MGRMTRLVMVLGGTALLVAMPREDYARLWAETQVAASRAYALINHHIVKPIRVAVTAPDEGAVSHVPAPRPVVRADFETGQRHIELAQAPIGEAKVGQAESTLASLPPDGSAAGRDSGPVQEIAHRETAHAPADLVASDPGVTVVADAGSPQSPTSPAAAGAPSTVDARQTGVTTAPVPVAALPVPAAAPLVQAKPVEENVKPRDAGDGEAQAAAGVPPVPLAKPEVPEDKKPPVAAKLLFGAAKTAAPLSARAIGFYSRGCLAGAKALPVDGSAWQAMRLSRNRNWGHPELIALIERFAKEVQKEDGWPGLLVGDISQPRGGPMLTGHSSHQIGLDADIWFTPMPGRRLSRRERETLSATSMISGPTKVDPTAFTPSHVRVVKRAASYPEVERILVHPAIKKALCEAAGDDRKWLGKVRPYFGHYYHFHIRLACPKGSQNCRSQRPPSGEDGCDKELAYWFRRLTAPPRPKTKETKPRPPKPPTTVADLPAECRVVLESGDGPAVKDEAELVKTSIERSKNIIDISGEPRADALARKAQQ